MSDRVCIRRCVAYETSANGLRRPLHYAGCIDYGAEAATICSGCVPRECRDGSLICDTCFGKARALLRDAPDLLGRLRSKADAAKSGWNWDNGPVIRSTGTSAPSPVGDDLLDAIHAVEHAMWFYGAGVEALSNNTAAMTQLGPLLLDTHAVDADGVRETWSLLDALKRWGLERRDTHRHVYPGRLPNAPLGSYAKYDEEEQGESVTEWYDSLITIKEAATRRGVSQRTIQRWADNGLITKVAESTDARGAKTRFFRASHVDAVDTAMEQKRTRPKPSAAMAPNQKDGSEAS